MKVLENIDLAEYSSIKIGGKAEYFCEIEKEEDVSEIIKFARNKSLDLIILGDGTNTFFGDGKIKKVFAKMKIMGRHKLYDNGDFANFIFGAGENWDEIVAFTIENGFCGLEKLSGIPGTIGAGPIQNIGAYGSEIKDYITNVKVYDTEYDEIVEIPNDQCLFEYRNSLFKKNPRRFIILAVSMQLKKNPDLQPIPEYKDLQLFFKIKNRKNATAKEIRDAVLEIREGKLPEWKKIPNLGSFFENPIVDAEHAQKLARDFPKMPQFLLPDGRIKIFAGWLIEEAGLKGHKFKNLGIHKNNALIVVNYDKSSAEDLLSYENYIKGIVEEKFDITLEREPNFIK